MITIEDLVPADHLLRKVNDIIDFSFIYDEVEGMYRSNNGRPAINPVILIKFLLIGFLYGIHSERRISEEIQVNMAYRWFLGLDIPDKVPDNSTISQNRRRRFNGSDLFRNIFQKTVAICIEKDLADGKLVFTDSTHIKANASRKTEYIKQTEEVTNEYLKELDQYEESVRNQLESEGKIKPVRCRKRKGKKNHEKDGTEKHAGVLLLRQIWSEGSFATQKARHNLKFLYRRGLEAAEQQCLLSSTALNLKRMIKAMA